MGAEAAVDLVEGFAQVEDGFVDGGAERVPLFFEGIGGFVEGAQGVGGLVEGFGEGVGAWDFVGQGAQGAGRAFGVFDGLFVAGAQDAGEGVLGEDGAESAGGWRIGNYSPFR